MIGRSARRLLSTTATRPHVAFGDVIESVADAGNAAQRKWTCNPGYNVAGAPNGGYMMASMTRAAQHAVAASGGSAGDPIALSAFFLRPAEPGTEYDVAVETLKESKRMTTHCVRAFHPGAGGQPSVQVTVTLGDPDAQPVPGMDRADGTSMPELPPPRECQSILGVFALNDPDSFPIACRNDARFDPAFVSRVQDRVAARGSDAGHAAPLSDDLPLNYECWLRFPPEPIDPHAAGAGGIDGAADPLAVPGDDREPHRGLDALALLLFADSLPPPVLLGFLPRFTWVPTIEMSVQVRGRPTPGGWLALRHTSRHVTGGWLEADTELWDAESGRLVALGRQMAMLMDPRRGKR